MTQRVDISYPMPADPQAAWSPVIGPETIGLLDRSGLGVDDEQTVRGQSASILARCAAPNVHAGRTGLVVGYIQSGKTMSFTTVIAMARDNGFPLIILLAGTKENLHSQTADRLARDLAIERPGGLSPWEMHKNPPPERASRVAQNIQSMMGSAPEKFRRATVITVMKNPTRLTHVLELIGHLEGYGIDIEQVPVLLVDDEADQAGLNAAAQSPDKDPTATYQAIVSLRGALPRHTYLMYTATPQAPLLINLADVLSPDFVTVLEPGVGYTGGSYFFVDHLKAFVRKLSPGAAAKALDPALDAPPRELKQALATYLLVVAQRGKGPVSMLVHPSQATGLHVKYNGFVVSICSQWRGLLEGDSVDRDELIAGLLMPAYNDLVEGGAELSPFDELISELHHWIGATQVRIVNSGTPEDSKIDWGTAPSWILIGGNKLDRGFTVEGLVVTYMPRKLGAGQVDSVQQRARFFGYKRAYGLLCRAWLNIDTSDAFEHYVVHERMLRADLQGVAERGLSLKDWRRRMLLDAAYKPTRRAIIDLPYFHDRIRGDTWVSLSRVPRAEASVRNRAVVEEFLKKNRKSFTDDERDPRQDGKHTRAIVAMNDVLELMASWSGHPEDQAFLNQAALLLRARLDSDGSLEAAVYRMDGGGKRRRTPTNGLVALQQGRNPQGGYQGDAKFFTDGVTSVQIHRLEVAGYEGNRTFALSVRIPASLSGAVLIQAG